MIQVLHLSKVYGSQKAVDDLSFSVGAGQILGFLGPNGAGKSTTMKILTGFLPATEGDVQVAGFDVREQVMEVRRRVGYLPEHNPLYLDMYVHEFLEFSCRLHRIPRTERKRRIAQVIEQTRLELEQHKPIRMLSKGYRQRVGLSHALLHEPEVLILDEPTTGLDPNQIIDIRALIREVGKDKTVIFSSHILSEVEAISDRILIIHHGKQVANASIEELRDSQSRSSYIRLEVEGPGLDFGPLIGHPGWQRLEPLNDRQFLIHTTQDIDLRKELFALCVAQDHVILEMQRKVFSLEDTFRQLTNASS